MKYLLIISIAKSLLLARWKQSLIAAIGVTFSIAMFVTLLSCMNGLNDMLDGLVLNRTPHVRLYNEIKPNEIQPVNLVPQYSGYHHFISSVKSVNSRQEIYNSGAIIKQINKDKRVLGYAPKIIAQAFFNDGTIDITGAVNGIDVEAESRLFFFNDYVTSGKAIDLKNVPNSIILGKGLADKLLADIGDVIQVIPLKAIEFLLKWWAFFNRDYKISIRCKALLLLPPCKSYW